MTETKTKAGKLADSAEYAIAAGRLHNDLVMEMAIELRRLEEENKYLIPNDVTLSLAAESITLRGNVTQLCGDITEKDLRIAQLEKLKFDLIDTVEACLVAAGASEDFDKMEKQVSSVGSKPSHFVAKQFSELRARTERSDPMIGM